MPKIRWNDLPSALRDHLFDRLRERKISAEDLYQLKLWRESEPEAPVAESEPEEPAGDETDASIEADAVDPTHQGPGDSEGHAPYAPDEAEPKPE